MRVTGGVFAGRKLATIGAGAPDAQLRPTSDRVREALFNALEHGDHPPLDGARVLDLFAGSGSLGLEAVSRGAARAVFIDDDARARALIRTSVEALDLTGRTKIYRRDALRLGVNRGDPFDYVFLDPPYGRAAAGPAITGALAGGWVAAGGRIVVETAKRDGFEPPDGASKLDDRVYGDTRISILAPAAA